MEKVITRNLLRSFYDSIKDKLGVATDQEIEDIIDGIDFADIPPVPVDVNDFQIYDVYPYDYHWYLAVGMDANSLDKLGKAQNYIIGSVTNKSDEFAFKSSIRHHNNLYIKQGEYENGQYLDGFTDSGVPDNCTKSLDDALVVDGKYLVVLYVGTPYDDTGSAYVDTSRANLPTARETMVGGNFEVNDWRTVQN